MVQRVIVAHRAEVLLCSKVLPWGIQWKWGWDDEAGTCSDNGIEGKGNVVNYDVNWNNSCAGADEVPTLYCHI